MSEGIKPKVRTTIYVDPMVWKKFKEICKREGSTPKKTSASKKVEDYMRIEISRHENGNPQLRLDRLFGEPLKKCGLCGEFFENVWLVKYVSGGIIPSCKSCIEEKREKGNLVKKVLRLM